MPTLVEINGLDEGGKVGEPIWFVRVGVRIDSEMQLLLRNLDHFGKLLVNKGDLQNREEKNLMKYLRDAVDDPSIDVSIFRMRIQTQVGIIKRYLEFLSDEMFRARGALIDGLKSTSKASPSEDGDVEEEGTQKSRSWQVVETLKRFKDPPFLYESLVKSYGMMSVTAGLDRISKLFRTPLSPGANHMLVVQIDGGYPFAFWWQSLVESSNLSNIKKRNTRIAGISQGDAYYPAVCTAGAISFILNKYPHRTFFLPVNELSYDDRFPIDDEFYTRHTTAVIRPTFDNRIIFVGVIDPDLLSCLPYCLHRTNRKKTYEPFHIEMSAESFFDEYGVGKPENTLVVLGKLTTAQHKEDARLCQRKGFECIHLADLRKDFEGLCTDVENEIDLLPKEKKAKLGGSLEEIKKGCLADLE